MTLERIDFLVWLFDETIEQAAERAKLFVSIFPFDREDKFSADEINDDKVARNKYPAWQLECFVNAHRTGIHYGFFEQNQGLDAVPETV